MAVDFGQPTDYGTDSMQRLRRRTQPSSVPTADEVRRSQAAVADAAAFASPRPRFVFGDTEYPESFSPSKNPSNDYDPAGKVGTGPGSKNTFTFSNGRTVSVDPAGAGSKRRTFSADESAYSPMQAPSIEDPRAVEQERQSRLKDIDQALFDLQNRNGGLNMRSKRELFGDLIGRKAGLTQDAYRTQNDRAVAGARIASDVAQTNAELGERAAARRSNARQFYDELGEKSLEFDQERQDKIAKANAPLSPKDRLEMAKLSADEARAADKYEQERPGVFEGVLQKRLDAMRKQGIPEDRIAVEAAKSAQALGVDPYSAPTAAAGADATKQRIADLYNNDGFVPFNLWGAFDDAAPRSSLTAGQLDPQAIRDFNSVRTEPTSLARRLLTGAPRYRFEVTNSTTGKPESRYSDDEQLYNDVRGLRRRGSSNVGQP